MYNVNVMYQILYSNSSLSVYQSRYNSLCILKYVSIQIKLSHTLSFLLNNGRFNYVFIDTQSYRALYSLPSKGISNCS